MATEHEIRHVVRSLCQGTTDEQRRTLDRYFTPDAEFVHPFCVAPRFKRGALRHVPLLDKLSSRDVVRGVYQWYRMLSPKIEMEFDAVCAFVPFIIIITFLLSGKPIPLLVMPSNGWEEGDLVVLCVHVFSVPPGGSDLTD